MAIFAVDTLKDPGSCRNNWRYVPGVPPPIEGAYTPISVQFVMIPAPVFVDDTRIPFIVPSIPLLNEPSDCGVSSKAVNSVRLNAAPCRALCRHPMILAVLFDAGVLSMFSNCP